jgi:hypothetical protein
MTMAVNEARKKAQDDARKAVQEQREERAKATAEAVKRMESTQPTPTQEENDLAKVGVVIEEKEDDGSGETVIERTIVANQPPGPGGYETRGMETKEAREARQAREREAREERRRQREGQ